MSTNIDDIPDYYKNTPIFKHMINSSVFVNLSFDEFKETETFKNISFISVIKDDDDFMKLIESLDYYCVEFLPQFVLDYIMSYKDGPFTMELNEVWDKQIITEILKLGLLTFYKIKDITLKEIIRKIITEERSNKISCGGYFTSAIKDDGSIKVWGDNDEGQYDNIPNDKFVSVSCGVSHTIALNEDGYISVFGSNNNGQYDNVPDGKFICISSNYYVNVALREDGAMVIWGKDMLIVHDKKFLFVVHEPENVYAIDENNSLISYDKNNNFNEFTIVEPGKFIFVSVGIFHISAIREDKTLFTKFIDNNDEPEDILLNELPDGKFSFITSGSHHTSALREDGSVFTWAFETYGGTFTESKHGKYVSIKAGESHTSGIMEDGTVTTWGTNDFDQLNNIPDGKFVSIACGLFHSSGIRDDGSFITWGGNDDNQYLKK